MKINRRILLFVSVLAVVIILGVIFKNSKKQDSVSGNRRESSLLASPPVTSNEGGVEITVTPINISKSSSEWSFGVSLTTHSGDLLEDMVEVSKLSFDSGKILKPTNWEGSPPGGHHRNGVLRFIGGSEIVSSFTLKIKNVGGVFEREFSWDLK